MHTGKGQVVELLLYNGFRQARISCSPNLTPAPGHYVMAGTASRPDLLPVPLYSTDSTASGFVACDPIPDYWSPATEVYLSGPLGNGFTVSHSSRKIALIVVENSSNRLAGLLRSVLKKGAEVVLVSGADESNLPDEVEVQPLESMRDVFDWADYVALDVDRERLPQLREQLFRQNQTSAGKEAQVLVRTPIPCGGIAECGVCAVGTKSSWKMACKDGPVFDLWDLI